MFTFTNNTLRTKAEKRLQRLNKRIEQEAWAEEYVNKMASVVERETAWGKQGGLPFNPTSRVMGLMSNVFERITRSKKKEQQEKEEEEVKQRKEEALEEELIKIQNDEKNIRIEYQLESRQKEAQALVYKIPGSRALKKTGTQDKAFNELICARCYQLAQKEKAEDLYKTYHHMRKSDEDISKLEENIKKEIDQKFSKDAEKAIQEELSAFDEVFGKDANPLNLRSRFKELLIRRNILADEQYNYENNNAAIVKELENVGKELEAIRKKMMLAIVYQSRNKEITNEELKEKIEYALGYRWDNWDSLAEKMINDIPNHEELSGDQKDEFLSEIVALEEEKERAKGIGLYNAFNALLWDSSEIKAKREKIRKKIDAAIKENVYKAKKTEQDKNIQEELKKYGVYEEGSNFSKIDPERQKELIDQFTHLVVEVSVLEKLKPKSDDLNLVKNQLEVVKKKIKLSSKAATEHNFGSLNNEEKLKLWAQIDLRALHGKEWKAAVNQFINDIPGNQKLSEETKKNFFEKLILVKIEYEKNDESYANKGVLGQIFENVHDGVQRVPGANVAVNAVFGVPERSAITREAQKIKDEICEEIDRIIREEGIVEFKKVIKEFEYNPYGSVLINQGKILQEDLLKAIINTKRKAVGINIGSEVDLEAYRKNWNKAKENAEKTISTMPGIRALSTDQQSALQENIIRLAEIQYIRMTKQYLDNLEKIENEIIDTINDKIYARLIEKNKAELEKSFSNYQFFEGFNERIKDKLKKEFFDLKVKEIIFNYEEVKDLDKNLQSVKKDLEKLNEKISNIIDYLNIYEVNDVDEEELQKRIDYATEVREGSKNRLSLWKENTANFLSRFTNLNKLSTEEKTEFFKKCMKLEESSDRLNGGFSILGVMVDFILGSEEDTQKKTIEKEIKEAIEKNIYKEFLEQEQNNIDLDLKSYPNLSEIDEGIYQLLVDDFIQLKLTIAIKTSSAIHPDSIEDKRTIEDLNKELEGARKRLELSIKYANKAIFQDLTGVLLEEKRKEVLQNIAYAALHEQEWQASANKFIEDIPGNHVISDKKKDFVIELIPLQESRMKRQEELKTTFAGHVFHDLREFFRSWVRYIGDSAKQVLPESVGNAINSTGNATFGDKVIVEVEQKEADIAKKIEQEINDKFEEMARQAYSEALSRHPDFNTLPMSLQKKLTTDLLRACADEKRMEENVPLKGDKEDNVALVELKINMAKKFSELPTFNQSSAAKQFKWVDAAAKHIRKLEQIKQEIKEYKKNEQVRELEQAKQAKKDCSLEIKKLVMDILTDQEFSERDKIFKVEDNAWADWFSELTDKAWGFLQSPEVQSALVGGVLGAAAGSYVPLYGTVTGGLIGAVAGYKKPGIHKLLAPFKFLANEIVDIVTKPKSYIDRGFRGGVMILAVVGTIAAIVAVSVLLGNPFTGLPLVGLVVATAAVIGVTYVASKAAKWISTKVSQKVYGIANPDRYKLTKEAKEVFEDDANKIRDYFVSEIRALQKILEGIKNKNSSEAHQCAARLYKLESTWDKIQLGNEDSLQAWETWSRHSYQEKKREYLKKVETEMEIHAKEVIRTLLDVAEPTSEGAQRKKAKEGTIEESKETAIKKPKKERVALTFLYKDTTQPSEARILQEVKKLEELNQIMLKRKSKLQAQTK